jgi:hypothetical protein
MGIAKVMDPNRAAATGSHEILLLYGHVWRDRGTEETEQWSLRRGHVSARIVRT